MVKLLSKRSTIRVFQLLFLLYIGTLFYLTLYSFQGSSIELPRHFLGLEFDKIVHFIMFIPFPIISLLAFRLTSIAKVLLPTVFVVGILVATATELLQLTTEYRFFEWADLVADWLAIIVGTIVAYFLKRALDHHSLPV